MAANAPLPDFEQLKDDLDHKSRIHPDARTAEMEATDCSICAEPIFGANDHNDRDGAPRRVRCGHIFHYTCIFQWVNGINPNRNRCPNCRGPLCKLNLLEPDKEAQWQAEEYARTYNTANFSIGMYSNLMELVDVHFSRQRYVYMQRRNEDWVRIISEVRTEWIRGGYEGLRCCQEHERMEWDWFEFEVARRVWESLLRADLDQTPKAKLFSAFLNAMDDNLHDRWFDNAPASEANDDQDMEDVQDAESVVEVVDVPQNGENAVPEAQDPANHAGHDAAAGAPEPAMNADQGAIPRAQEPASDADQNAVARARRQAALNRIMFRDSVSGSTPAVSGRSARSGHQQQPSVSPRPIPVFLSGAPVQHAQQAAGQPIPLARSEPRVQQDAPRPASLSNANIRSHNSNHDLAADDDSDADSDGNGLPIATPPISWRGPLISTSAGPPARTAFGTASNHSRASTHRSRRPTIRSPAVRQQERFDDARHDRELRHLQQSEVLRARRRLEEHDHIVLEVVRNAGQVLWLDNMEWRVMRSNGEEMCEVSGAIGYQFVGETAIFYRNKI